MRRSIRLLRLLPHMPGKLMINLRPGRNRVALAVAIGLAVVAGLWIGVAPVQAARYSIVGRISSDSPTLCYRAVLSDSTNLKIGMTVVTGSLKPFVVIRQEKSTDFAQRGDLAASEQVSTIDYPKAPSGTYEIIATSQPDSNTTGDFVLVIEGSNDIQPVATSTDPCPAKPSSTGAIASDVTADLPRPKNGQPAVLLPINITVAGVINNQSYIVYYLIDAQDQTYASYDITMWRTGDKSTLEPFMGVLAIDKEEEVLERGVPVDSETISIHFVPKDHPQNRWYVLAVTRVDIESGTSQGTYNLNVIGNR